MQDLDIRKEKILNFVNDDLELFKHVESSGIRIVSVKMVNGVILDKIIKKSSNYQNVCSFNLRNESCVDYCLVDFFNNNYKIKNNSYYNISCSMMGAKEDNNFLSLMLTDTKILKETDQNLLEERWALDFSMYSQNPIHIILEEKDNIIDKYFAAKISSNSNYWMLSKSLDFKNDELCFHHSKDFLIKNGIHIEQKDFTDSFSEIIKNIFLFDY